MKIFSKSKIALFLIAAFGLTACQNQPTTTVNGNQTNISNVPIVGNVNVTTNTNSNSANSNVLAGDNVGIEAKEPDQYQAKVTLKLETSGPEKTAALPTLSAVVAKSGNDKRMEFSLPNNEKIIYLDRGGQQLIVYPQRKQYAELNKESLGFEIRQLLMPEQIVKKVQNIRGVKRSGEEKFGARDVIKYTYSATTQVNSQPPTTAANSQSPTNVATDSVVLVDKETGLPLRSETYAESQNSTVSGMKSLRLVTEMTDLQTTVDPSLFAEPTDYKKVAPEEIRSQVDLIFRAIGALLQQAMNSQTSGGGNQPPTLNSPAPAAKP